MLNLVFLIGFIFATGSAARSMAADRVKLALPAKSMGYLPLFIALQRGFFKDEAIDIEIPMMLPQLAHNALMSGEVDYHGAADSALRLAAKGRAAQGDLFRRRAAQLFYDGQTASESRRRPARQIHRHGPLR